ncbi:ABC transporter permease [Halocatena halophila]|uniref:ABC transporter permease n=1 Tax=Halocatena halophila TaxID=2814576 RepID=UPI002ED123BA
MNPIQNRLRSIKSSLVDRRESSVLVGLIALIALGIAMNASSFLTISNAIRVFRGAAIVAIIGYSMSLLMVTAEFDLSVGSLVGITGGLAAVMISGGFDPVFTIVLVITLAMIYGVTQGLLVTKLGLPSLIVTIGTLTLLRGAHFLLLGGQAVTISTAEAGPVMKAIGGTYTLPLPVGIPFTDVTLFSIPALTYALPGVHDEPQTFTSFPAQILWVLALLAVLHHILFRTRFGHHVRATGDNINAAETTGLDPHRIKIACFAIVGGVTAFAGLSQLAYVGSVSPGTGTGTELIVIAAVVLGGTKLTGGEGSMTGVLMGALVLGFAQNILTLGGFGPKFSRLITGLFIIAAIGLDTVFSEFSFRLIREWYTRPLAQIARSPRSFFSDQAPEKGSTEAIAFVAVSILAIGGIVASLALLASFLAPPFADRFVLFIAEANLSGAVMVLLEVYLVITLLVLLAVFTVHPVATHRHSSSNGDSTLVAVGYGMAPAIFLFAPFTLYGFGFLSILVYGSLVVVAVLMAVTLWISVRSLHDLSPIDGAITVGATYAVWIVVAVYFASNLV